MRITDEYRPARIQHWSYTAFPEMKELWVEQSTARENLSHGHFTSFLDAF